MATAKKATDAYSNTNCTIAIDTLSPTPAAIIAPCSAAALRRRRGQECQTQSGTYGEGKQDCRPNVRCLRIPRTQGRSCHLCISSRQFSRMLSLGDSQAWEFELLQR